MNRTRGLALVLSLCSALPAVAAAQEFKDTKYTKDADKFIALAMTRSDQATRREMYQQALDALQEGFVKEADNGRIWYTAGQAYVGLGRYASADSCFDRAATLHPPAVEDIEAERESGWMQAFREGVELMDQQQFEQARVVLEGGQLLYDKRPEALLNLGSLYANLGDHDKAVDAFRRAARAAQGDLLAKLDSASQEQWRGYVDLAMVNIAQIRGGQGVDAFGESDFDAAMAAFQEAVEINPYSRDYLFNHVQARYAKATKLEEELEADAGRLDQLRPQLTAIYEALRSDIPKVREFDPTNEHLMLILARAVRRQGELAGDTTTAREGALAILQEIDAVPVEVMDLSIAPDEETATVSGNIRNKKLAAGTAVTIEITLLDHKGQTVGQVQAMANVGEAESLTPFEQTSPTTGQVAGWRYRISAS